MKKDEIKQALKCCVSTEYGMCKQCPNYDCVKEDCVDNLKRQALALITEQEKEIDLLQMQMKDVVNHADTFLAEANKFETENKKLKAEIEQRKIDYDILYKKSTKRLKQAKIDVLNELKERTYRDSVYYPEVKYEHKYVHMDDIDEMIEELKK